jgi:prepilin-type N-terminal cleavage/methylation domain-containing protein
MCCRKRRARERTAFTLVELLVVITIIALLLGILLPALSAVRSRAKNVAARSFLKSLSTASVTYQADFSAYPGYYSEDEINGSNTWHDFTSTENLVISLLGGIADTGTGTGWTPTGVPASPQIFVDDIGIGPKLASGRTKDAYFSPKTGELATVTGNNFSSDNNVPEFIDPVSGQPVLYFRARSAGTQPVTLNTAAGTFNRLPNVAYINSNITGSNGESRDQRNKSAISNVAVGSQSQADENLAWLAVSTQLTDTVNANGNETSDVVAASMLFVAPGKDGIYLAIDQIGTTNIDSEDDLDGADDIWLTGP